MYIIYLYTYIYVCEYKYVLFFQTNQGSSGSMVEHLSSEQKVEGSSPFSVNILLFLYQQTFIILLFKSTHYYYCCYYYYTIERYLYYDTIIIITCFTILFIIPAPLFPLLIRRNLTCIGIFDVIIHKLTTFHIFKVKSWLIQLTY